MWTFHTQLQDISYSEKATRQHCFHQTNQGGSHQHNPLLLAAMQKWKGRSKAKAFVGSLYLPDIVMAYPAGYLQKCSNYLDGFLCQQQNTKYMCLFKTKLASSIG